MSFVWFAEWDVAPDRLSVVRIAAAAPGLRRGLVHVPARAHDPLLDDGTQPALVLQLYFDELGRLEAALAPDGCLQALAVHGVARQQAMLVRKIGTARADEGCSYVVTYDGSSEDENAWLAAYLREHPPVMARFPGIREIEVCTRLDWCGFLPAARANALLRNRVVFDNAEALTAALNSLVRHELRAHMQQFPPFAGTVTHYPMFTSLFM